LLIFRRALSPPTPGSPAAAHLAVFAVGVRPPILWEEGRFRRS